MRKADRLERSAHTDSITPLPSRGDRHFRTDHLRANLAQRAMRGGSVTIAAQAIKILLQLVATVLLARLLSPRDFGLVGMVTAVTGFMAVFTDMGLSQATVQRNEITQGQVSTLFWVNTAVGLALSLLTVALAPVIASFYGEPRVLWIAVALAGAFAVSGLSVQHKALLDRQMRFRVKAMVDVTAMTVAVGAALAAAYTGLGYWALVIMPVTTAVMTTLGFWTLCRWRPGRPKWSVGVSAMLGFGGHLTGFNFFNYIGRNIDNILIGRVWGARQLGLYARAYQLLLLPIQQVNAPVAAVAVPALSRLVRDPSEYRRAYLRIVEKVGLLTLPLVALMIAVPDWIVRVVLAPQWERAAPIFLWLSNAAHSASRSWTRLGVHRLRQ